MSIKRIVKQCVSLPVIIASKIQFAVCGVKCGTNLSIYSHLVHLKTKPGKITIGNNVCINSSRRANPIGHGSDIWLITYGDGDITIGNNVGMSNCTIVSASRVTICDGACIGGGVQIMDTDFHSVYAEHRLNGNTNIVSKPIIVGKESFIGADAYILKGVTIGTRAVIGAGSVVTKDIPAGEVWAGNPARYISRLYE